MDARFRRVERMDAIYDNKMPVRPSEASRRTSQKHPPLSAVRVDATAATGAGSDIPPARGEVCDAVSPARTVEQRILLRILSRPR